MSCIGQFRNMEACPDQFHPEYPVCVACMDAQIRVAMQINDPREEYTSQSQERSVRHDPVHL